MKDDGGIYSFDVAERFWKEEIILTPCEMCIKKKKCFSLFEMSTCERAINDAFEKIRNCKIRHEILWGQL